MTLEEMAIEGVKNYLVDLLQKKSWCKARLIGVALEGLINTQLAPRREQELNSAGTTERR